MGASRFPNGISFVKPGVAAPTFTAGDTTPDVSNGSYFHTDDSLVTIANFDGGERGKFITVISGSGGSTTIQNSAGGINITSLVYSVSAGLLTPSVNTGNAVMLNNEALTFYHNGTDWHATSTRVVDANA
jgi:hypothetical protein